DKDILLKGLTTLFNLKTQITVYDKQKNMENFYKNIDCIVVPSKNETFGLVTLEAMSYGKTVLVSNSAGSSEIVTYNNGFVFNRNSLSDFVQKIIKLSNIYSQDFKYFTELSENSYKISKEYTWHNFASKILENI
nr:glycosyltransferase family 4 protein [Cyanobacteria bacterium RUI128]